MKLPAVLHSLNDDTKQCIMEWANMVQAKHISDVVDSDDDDNITYFGDPLLIIEWNETGLIQRNVQKNTVVNYIRTFQGCNPFPGLGRLPSGSLFYIVDTQNIEAQQIINNIIYGLQRTYARINVPSLGKVYSVFAERRDKLKVGEILGVFSL
ncbi:20344_t:CDS:2 [Cetraspora pellucida]|uniref:20344_t:CDS:1 n=1 Tax=Cetraspora pellucida TaxID=1433469 RepID=A0A9N9BD94_9GLOM|nr:20344_t:CDS:2 [Cetraspora pellucida]